MQNGQERKPDLVCSLEKEGFLGSFYQGDRYVDKAVILWEAVENHGMW